MARQNGNTLYEPLYRDQTKELNRLRRENHRLLAENTELRRRITDLEAAIKKLTDTKTRFRFFLFGEKKQSPDRCKAWI